MTAFKFAQTIPQLPVAQQNAFLARIKENLSEEEYTATATFLSLFGMFQNPEKYEAMKNAVCEMVFEELYGHAN